MTFTFLQEEIETILLFATAPIYFAVVGILQSKNLRMLDSMKRKKRDTQTKNELLKKLKKLKFCTPVFMMIGLTIHILTSLIFGMEELRYGYFISISIMYVIYTVISLLNFYLKGTGILKDIGDFNGLSGN